MSETRVLKVPSGTVTLKIPQIYALRGIIELDRETLEAFAKLFRVETKYSDVISVLIENNLLSASDLIYVSDKELLALTNLDKNDFKGILLKYSIETPDDKWYIFKKAVSVILAGREILSYSRGSTKKEIKKEIKIEGTHVGEVERKRRLIYNEILKDLGGNSNPVNISTQILQHMFNLYDSEFFNGELDKLIKNTKSVVNFTFGKGTKTAGMCSGQRTSGSCSYIITIHWIVFNTAFNSNSGKELEVNGLKSTNKIEALQLVFEHELLHLWFMLNNRPSGHNIEFKNKARDMFLHTHTKHKLLWGEEDDPERKSFSKTDLQVGMTVEYETKTGANKQTMIGSIIKLNPKRAVIKVGPSNYSVPYELIKNIVELTV